MDFVDPAGSVLSTPEDMARYMRLYLNGGKTASGAQLISPATFAAMTRRTLLEENRRVPTSSSSRRRPPFIVNTGWVFRSSRTTAII